MTFLSQRPNLDPKPWVFRGKRYAEKPAHPYAEHPGYVPRPEFDVGDNPILLAVCDYEFPVEELASLDLERGGDDRWFWLEQGATPEQIAHARTVLEAIVREK